MNPVKRYWHWCLPIIGPFVTLAFIRLLWWAADAPYTWPSAVALMSWLTSPFWLLVTLFIEGEHH